jgi:hypothetical protein
MKKRTEKQKEAARVAAKKHYQRNREKILAKAALNKDKKSAYDKKKRQENIERYSDRDFAYREKNFKKIAAYRKANRDRINEAARAKRAEKNKKS